MIFDLTIPIWGIITVLGAAVIGLVRMWIKQLEHSKQLDLLRKEQEEIRSLVIEKNEKTYAEIKKLENAFSVQKETLIEIKTLMNLMLNNRIKRDEGD